MKKIILKDKEKKFLLIVIGAILLASAILASYEITAFIHGFFNENGDKKLRTRIEKLEKKVNILESKCLYEKGEN